MLPSDSTISIPKTIMGGSAMAILYTVCMNLESAEVPAVSDFLTLYAYRPKPK